MTHPSITYADSLFSELRESEKTKLIKSVDENNITYSLTNRAGLKYLNYILIPYSLEKEGGDAELSSQIYPFIDYRFEQLESNDALNACSDVAFEHFSLALRGKMKVATYRFLGVKSKHLVSEEPNDHISLPNGFIAKYGKLIDSQDFV